MKLLLTIIIPILFVSYSFGQHSSIDLNKIHFKGLGYTLSKEKIVAKFGKPAIKYPEYECGFYTDDQPGGPYYQLVYEGFNYIGSDKERFILENVQLDPAGTIRLVYAGKELSGRTTKAQFAAIFGKAVKEQIRKNPNQDSILLFSKGSDDGVVFHFKGGKLVKFEYWSPC